MAYGVKWRCEFTDIQGDDWRVDILEDSYAGAITSMIASGSPLSIDWLTPGDDLTLGPIKGSMVTLNVECTTNFEYKGLYSEADLVRPMNVYKNEVLYWSGWLSNEYTEPYDNVPYTVSITAADALGILKNIEYKDEGEDYTGRVTETEIILEILAKIGHTTFTEFCNLYEDRMDDGVTASPFNQAYIDNDLFIDADCYSVLQAILLKYNAVIRQKAGEFIIYRPVELIGDTVYGRVITAASTTGTSMAPDHIIDRDGLDLIDFEGGVLMYKEPMSKLTVEQDYGSRESWIRNHTLNIDTWDGSAVEFEKWDHWGAQHISYENGLKNELSGIEMMPDGTGGSYYATQEFGEMAKACAGLFVFSFDYRLIKPSTGSVADVEFDIILCDSAENYYLNEDSFDDDTTASWENSLDSVRKHIDSVPTGNGEWKTAKYVIAGGLPADGPYKITLHSTNKTTVRVAYRDVRFYATADALVSRTKKVSRWGKGWNVLPPLGLIRFFGGGYKKAKIDDIEDNVEVVSRTYEVDNSINGSEGELAYIIGDCENTGIVNVLAQFKGALAINSSGSLVQTAIDFVNSHASAYTAGDVTVTSTSNKIVFTSSVAGTNFTGNTTITNATGDLAGTVATVTANSVSQEQIDTITITPSSGGSGTADIYCNGVIREITWTTNRSLSISNFVGDHEAAYAAAGVTLTSTTSTLIFTASTPGVPFSNPTYINNTSGTISGTIANTQANITGVARVDHVTLTGTSGTANVLCDGVTRTATLNTDTVYEHTASWHTRGNTEALPLAELIGDEVADMYSKGREFVQLNMYELTESLDILGNLQDPLNVVGSNNRVFAFNRGSLDCRMREWTIDIIEIGDKY